MTNKLQNRLDSIDRLASAIALRDCVRRALCLRRARFHAVIAAAGIASLTPLALGAAFPPVLQLGSLYPAGGGDGSKGFVLPGIQATAYSGHSLSAAGDVNGDGMDDFIVGAPGADAPPTFNAGASYVVFGTALGFPAVFRFDSLYPGGGGDGSHGFVLKGTNSNDNSGWSVSNAGDVNGDGVDDLIVGAYTANATAGETYVVFGSTQGFPAVFPLASLKPGGGGDGSRGFVLKGIAQRDQSGYAVSAAGDVNGDGVDDLIIGANTSGGVNGDEAGASYVVFGSTQAFPPIMQLASLFPARGGDGSRGFMIAGVDEYDQTGHSLSAAGDVNGDGVDDLVLGGFHSAPGESYVVFGSTQPFAPIMQLASLFPATGGDGSRGFVIAGAHANDWSGNSVSGAGDVNADGIDDLLIGAPLADPNGLRSAGESYVVFGSTQTFPAIFPLASLFPDDGGDGSRGFVLTGIAKNDGSGDAVSAAGDVNGDGIDDVVIGADGADPDGRSAAGATYVVFGSTQAFPAVFALASLKPSGGGDGSRGFILNGIDANDLSGITVSAAGDVNSDGVDDVIIGAWTAAPLGESRAGESYVVFGRTDAL
jgi:hypothetical protein